MDGLVRVVLTNFCVPRGPRFGGAAGGGPRGTQKLIFFCSHEPFTKIFLKRKPRENLAKTWRKASDVVSMPASSSTTDQAWKRIFKPEIRHGNDLHA